MRAYFSFHEIQLFLFLGDWTMKRCIHEFMPCRGSDWAARNRSNKNVTETFHSRALRLIFRESLQCSAWDIEFWKCVNECWITSCYAKVHKTFATWLFTCLWLKSCKLVTFQCFWCELARWKKVLIGRKLFMSLIGIFDGFSMSQRKSQTLHTFASI